MLSRDLNYADYLQLDKVLDSQVSDDLCISDQVAEVAEP